MSARKQLLIPIHLSLCANHPSVGVDGIRSGVYRTYTMYLVGFVTVAMMVLAAGVQAASEQDQNPVSLWEDFNHYVRVARPDLANAAGTALLDNVTKQELLDIVESSDYKNHEQTLLRASRVETLKETSDRLADYIQTARIERSRDPQRILADIQKLSEGKRANLNATERLKAAGQYASPYLLATILDENQVKLHPLVLSAMVAVGRSLVYPLSETLPHLEPVQLGQISQVLAEIGYPEALPHLKQVLEKNQANQETLSVVQSAFDRLLKNSNATEYMTSAQLHLMLGWRRYEAKTKNMSLPGHDDATNTGLVWEFDRDAGLVAIPVPGEVYGNVLAMRSSQQALRLEPEMDEALSLWLMANLRRENGLPPGTPDKSYSNSMPPPSFFIEMAGPLRQHDVLDQALDDRDVDLALDAISALSATAGTAALINREGTVQPLLRALAYPDRRVRFNAAFAMTNAQPQFSFPGSDLVIPVLAETIRQSGTPYAMVISADQESLNALMAKVRELGYQPIGGLGLEDVVNQISITPSVEMIIVEDNAPHVEAVYRQASVDYRLASVPVLAIVTPVDRINLTERLKNRNRLFFVLKDAELDELRTNLEQASLSNLGSAITPEESDGLALTALRLLRSVAASNNRVFDVSDALPTLIQALNDNRQKVTTEAARVLALIDDPEAQRAIADAALESSRPLNPRIALFESLSESARFFGNYLLDLQLAKLLELIKTDRGGLIIAAAKAHGALTLPTANVVELIAQQ